MLLDAAILDELERRLDAAEKKYEEADLEAKLKQLEESKQRQVNVDELCQLTEICNSLKFLPSFKERLCLRMSMIW